MQAIKDYYGVLELEPSANRAEIKKAYRKLAHQYHPDKNAGDLYAAAQFAEIKEAYEVLTNPSRKDFYLQQRWYEKSMAKKPAQSNSTPLDILKQALELDKYISRLDVHRLDAPGLFGYIMEIISDSVILKLNSFNEQEINRGIIDSILSSSSVLGFPFLEKVCNQLLKINTDFATQARIQTDLGLSRFTHQRDKYKTWLILLAALVICFLIYFVSR